MIELTQERLKQILRYDPETGVFTRLGWGVGAVAGSKHSQGYVSIEIDRKGYLAHRLAFLYMTGQWPEQIDHINRDRSDNRWSNLRECTNQENARNTGPRANNKSGYKGVYYYRGWWRANITHDGRTTNLGPFPCKEDAIAARQRAEEQLWQQCSSQF